MKRLKQIVLGLGMAAAIAAAPVPVYAMEDGAYTVGRNNILWQIRRRDRP